MKNKKIINLLLIFVVIICLVYLYSKGTYTIFESKVDSYINPDIADWNIKVNGVVVTSADPVVVNISDVAWNSTNVADNKLAPGSTGVLDINIDPTDTDVAIKFDLEIIDKNIDPLKILTVSSITDSSNQLIRTGVNTYTGIITLDEISSGTIENIKLNIEWIDNGEDIDFDTITDNSEDYLEINFTAMQYRGEEIVSYTE